MKLPVLMYHGINSDKHKYKHRSEDELYWVTEEDRFHEQLKWIKKEGFKTILLKDVNKIYQKIRPLDKYIIITFDDGHETDYYNAYPILKEFGFKAEFFITTAWINTNNYMQKSQLIELANNGMSIQSHAHSHTFLTKLSDNEINKELYLSKQILSDILGYEVNYISYPGGRFNTHIEKLVIKNKYNGSCNSIPGFNKISHDIHGLKRFGIKNNTLAKDFFNVLKLNSTYFLIKKYKIYFNSIIKNMLGDKYYLKLKMIKNKYMK